MSLSNGLTSKSERTTLIVALPAGDFDRSKLTNHPNIIGDQGGLINIRINEQTVLQYNTSLNVFTIYNHIDQNKPDIYEVVARALSEVNHGAEENARPGPIMISMSYLLNKNNFISAFENLPNLFNPGKYNHLNSQFNLSYEKPGYPYRIIVSIGILDEQFRLVEIGFINNVNGVADLRELLHNLETFAESEVNSIFGNLESKLLANVYT